MDIGTALDAFMTEGRVLFSRPLGEGCRLVLTGFASEPRFRIDRVRDGVATPYHETSDAGTARTVFDAAPDVDPPWHHAYLPVGAASPAPEDLTVRVFAAGSTVADCVSGFLASKGAVLEPDSVVREDGNGVEFQWGARFRDTEGTSFKAAGRGVPGGHVMTWCK